MIKKAIIILFFLFFLSLTAGAASYIDPALKWKTFETLHFRINYYDELKEEAVKMANMAEEVHSILSSLFKHVPDIKTDVVLLDTTDYGNGYTSVFPNPTIVIYISQASSNLSPYYYKDWLKFVFIHEYAHLLNLDTVPEGMIFFKTVFGRSIFPNTLSPQFLIEGIATYIETKSGIGGRGNDPRWLAMLRMDALEDNLKNIDEASVTTTKWPLGNLSYLYGVSFLQYLSGKYGDEKLFTLSLNYGDYIFSYGIDGAFKYVYGKNLSDLWKEWEESIKERSQKEQREVLLKGGLVYPNTITKKGYYSIMPEWSKNSSEIYFVKSNADEQATISKIYISSLTQEVVLEGSVFDDSMYIDEDFIVFSKLGFYKNFYHYKDLYSLDMKNKNMKRITNGERASDPFCSDDGNYLSYVKNDKGTKRLCVFDLRNNTLEVVGDATNGIEYFSPSFFDGSRKILTAKRYGGKQKIFIVDILLKKESVLIASSMSLEANPDISKDGKYVLFDSDVTGIPNIYAFDMDSGKIYQITNVLGMAIMPKISPDGKKIAFVNYSSKGYDLAVIDFDPDSWKEYIPKREENHETPKKEKRDKNEIILKSYDYFPLNSLYPKFWLPYSYRTDNGSNLKLYTLGIDALSQQYFSFSGGFDWKGKKPFYDFSYLNDQLYPQINLMLSDNSNAYLWSGNSEIYWQREQSGGLYATIYKNSVVLDYDSQSLTFGFENISLSDISSTDSFPVKPTEGVLNGLFLGYKYSSLRTTRKGVYPEEGFSVSAWTKLYSKAFASNFDLNKYKFSFSKYFCSPYPHNVLGVLGSLSLNYGDTFTQSGFDYDPVFIRGYPYSSVYGSKIAYTGIKYGFPLFYPEVGMGYGYLFFDRVWGEFFYEGVEADLKNNYQGLLKRWYGAQVNFGTINGWEMLPVNISLAYAKGIDVDGENKVYLNFALY